MTWVDVIKVDDFPKGSREIVDLDFTTVLVFNLNDEYYAIDHLCTHADFGLEDAECEKNIITCPYHGAKFCIKTGKVMAPPAFEDIETFETRVSNGMVQVYDSSE